MDEFCVEVYVENLINEFSLACEEIKTDNKLPLSFEIITVPSDGDEFYYISGNKICYDVYDCTDEKSRALTKNTIIFKSYIGALLFRDFNQIINIARRSFLPYFDNTCFGLNEFGNITLYIHNDFCVQGVSYFEYNIASILLSKLDCGLLKEYIMYSRV